MSFLVLVVDDEPDVEMLFRQQFRRDLRDNRFKMDGFTGLSAAYHLAESGLSVAVLDAADIGWGASGRNGGMLPPRYKKGFAYLAQSKAAVRSKCPLLGAERKTYARIELFRF